MALRPMANHTEGQCAQRRLVVERSEHHHDDERGGELRHVQDVDEPRRGGRNVVFALSFVVPMGILHMNENGVLEEE